MSTRALSRAYTSCIKPHCTCKVLERFKQSMVINSLEEALRGGYEEMAYLNSAFAEADMASDSLLLEHYETHLSAGEEPWR